MASAWGHSTDKQIDSLLSSFGLSIEHSGFLLSQLGQDAKELVAAFQDCLKHWSSLDETVKHQAMQDVATKACSLGARASVEYLLPHLKTMIDHQSNSA